MRRATALLAGLSLLVAACSGDGGGGDAGGGPSGTCADTTTIRPSEPLPGACPPDPPDRPASRIARHLGGDLRLCHRRGAWRRPAIPKCSPSPPDWLPVSGGPVLVTDPPPPDGSDAEVTPDVALEAELARLMPQRLHAIGFESPPATPRGTDVVRLSAGPFVAGG